MFVISVVRKSLVAAAALAAGLADAAGLAQAAPVEWPTYLAHGQSDCEGGSAWSCSRSLIRI
jgi:hypothetical protein